MNFTMNLIFIINTIATHCFQDFLNNFWKTVVHPEIEPENKWENVIALRNSKYRNWLDFNNLHPQKSIIIRYEDINTEESATKIMETFVKKFNLQPGVVWIITKLMKKQKWTGFILFFSENFGIAGWNVVTAGGNFSAIFFASHCQFVCLVLVMCFVSKYHFPIFNTWLLFILWLDKS